MGIRTSECFLSKCFREINKHLIVEEAQVKKGDKIAALDQTDIDLQIAKEQMDIEATKLKIQQTSDTLATSEEKANNAIRQAEIALSQAETSRNQVVNGTRSEDIQKQKLAVEAARTSLEYQRKLYNQMLNLEETYQSSSETAGQTAKQIRDQKEAAKN